MMISYAQNFEDVMLERALAEIKNGFYVDVGAWHPDLDSVTRHFFGRGWRGVNIEPNPRYLALLKEKRAHDVNLGLAVGTHNGRATITLIHGTGMSTLHPDIAEGHAKLDFEQEQLDVELRTLNSVFKEHAAATTHFLKIECEGKEANVINAFDLRKSAPGSFSSSRRSCSRARRRMRIGSRIHSRAIHHPAERIRPLSRRAHDDPGS